jgi:hypothetical protein
MSSDAERERARRQQQIDAIRQQPREIEVKNQPSSQMVAYKTNETSNSNFDDLARRFDIIKISIYV